MSGEEVRRRWRSLDERQRALADELLERAVAFLDGCGDLSIGEALDLAADAVQRRAMVFRTAPDGPDVDVAVLPKQPVVDAEAAAESEPAVSSAETREEPVGVVLAHRGTHCRRGHLYSPENTAFDTDGARRCRTCKRAYALQRLSDPKVREAHRMYNRERQRRIRVAALQQGGA